jgi:hypothetical protein
VSHTLLIPFAVLFPSPAAGQPPAARGDTTPQISKLLDMKPFPVGDSDGPLLKLQKERFNARLEAARLNAKAVQAGAMNTNQFNELLAVLASNAADVEPKPEGKVKWMELRVDVLKSQEAMARKRAEVGVENASASLLAKAARIDAEIDLLKLKESLKGDKGTGERK